MARLSSDAWHYGVVVCLLGTLYFDMLVAKWLRLMVRKG